MISPTALVKRVGVGGRLVPFFKCVCVYFLAMGAGGSDPSLIGVATKCAPILCLLLVVVLHHGSLPYEKGWYARRIAAGLALSALGDAFLVWPQHFIAGMAAFAAAHISYISAFRFTPLAKPLAPIVYSGCGYYMTLITPPDGLKVLVPVYGILLSTMAWRGLARGRAAAVGAVLFLISDAILGYSLFGGPVPYKQVLVMSTYYLGQLGIALSALDARTTTDQTS
ncbi:lysoplasmalogenase [Bombyx mandarina]|uniref:lysoplasmalogenase n=1 Tax=Bombyx mandarina TaxID=7092 RepID=A0A6J2K3S8_BOMMA|nr:lysoplasmalogenase [Bombyx mandarina]